MSTELRRLRNYIDGEFRDAADGRTTEVVNPATGEAYATAPLSGPGRRRRRHGGRRRRLPGLARHHPGRAPEGPAEDRGRVRGAGRGTDRGRGRRTPASRSGSPGTEEIPPMVDQIRFFAGAARMLEGRSAGEYMEGMTSIVRREPVGVCAQVAPWNYPMMMAVWKFAPALAAGNTVVLKPSDTTPASTVLIAEIIGSDPAQGRLQRHLRRPRHRPAMVEHPTPAMASITGSVRAGMQVAESRVQGRQARPPGARRQGAGRRLRGHRHRQGRRGHLGRGLLQRRPGLYGRHPRPRPRVDPRRVRRRARQGRRRDEDRPAGRRGRALRPAQQRRTSSKQVTGFIERLPAHAKVEAGGHRVGEKGYFYAPTVVSGLKQDDEIIQNEVFGPVITVQSFTDEAQAVE